MKNPDWTRDELILATQFYKQHRPSIPGKSHPELIALSEEIRAVASCLNLRGGETFRNAAGVYMKLMELRKYDPGYLGKGLGRKQRRIEKECWDLSDLVLRQAAQRIRETMDLFNLEGITVEELNGGDDDETEALEGRLASRVHRYRERSQKIVHEKKRSFHAKHGALFCEACGFNFETVYGARGEHFIECHHTLPVSEMEAAAKTKLNELALLCANCHRMVHAKRPWLSVEELREILSR
ncbi:HNH endonuclease [Halocynthiibacter sp. C4]|uniref:HNH endonuclease n=1 Tax=Halocynthiibacter sp. C4 TaxID=2992758 RepID=UPI00237B8D4C|nr:HNH endonuclease [Halocynthiibacter sp. C4]MDE0591591.1 HNH endonuclease [Halocynthiibacter sp. C4]